MKKYNVILSAFLIFFSTVTFSDDEAKSAFADYETKRAFDRLKTLEGKWASSYEGHLDETIIRVMSLGNSIMHEMAPSHMPENPITMFYTEGENLLLTHYCDAGNRPRMKGSISEDGNVVEFKFLDVTDLKPHQRGNMSNLVITIMDENHYTEEWTYTLQDGKGTQLNFLRDNKRVK